MTASIAAMARNWPLRLRLAVFAFGDFAFNLYWQSVMLYLLFYYTEALGIGMATAATTYMVASIWDGIASFAVGAFVDRRGAKISHRIILMAGAVPLGLTFMLAYMELPVAGAPGVAFVFAGHILFRTLYALVNVPYLAMSARISADSRDRAFVAGLRMLSGTGAAILVALGTLPIGGWLYGDGNTASAYLGAAIIFAIMGSVILFIVGATFREADVPVESMQLSVLDALRSLLSNRAFVTLNLAMMAMIVGVTVLNKSVLYYFKYFLDDEASGQLALASMGAVSAIALPVWMWLSRPVGVRALWFFAVGLCLVGLGFFSVIDIHSAGAMQIFLMGVQVAIVGLNFVFWAMLPDTIEFGQHETGLRVEGTVFGLAALLQRVAIGLATLILGWSLSSAGFVANVAQSDATLSMMGRTLALVPIGFLLLSAVLMSFNPLHRDTHDRIVRTLAAKARRRIPISQRSK